LGVWKENNVWATQHAGQDLGRFASEEAAAWAYDEAVRAHYGTEGRVNGINKPEAWEPIHVMKAKQGEGYVRQSNGSKKWIVKLGPRLKIAYTAESAEEILKNFRADYVAAQNAQQEKKLEAAIRRIARKCCWNTYVTNEQWRRDSGI